VVQPGQDRDGDNSTGALHRSPVLSAAQRREHPEVFFTSPSARACRASRGSADMGFHIVRRRCSAPFLVGWFGNSFQRILRRLVFGTVEIGKGKQLKRSELDSHIGRGPPAQKGRGRLRDRSSIGSV
jgi:hypothetical protein